MGLPFVIIEGPVFLIDESGNIAKVSVNKDLQTSDTVNTSAVSSLLSLVVGTPKELKVGASTLSTRKLVMAQALSNNIIFGFGNGAGQRPFNLFKNQSLVSGIGPTVALWFEITGANGNIAIAELA